MSLIHIKVKGTKMRVELYRTVSFCRFEVEVCKTGIVTHCLQDVFDRGSLKISSLNIQVCFSLLYIKLLDTVVTRGLARIAHVACSLKSDLIYQNLKY